MIIAAFLVLASWQADPPEAREHFRDRQEDLILLARKLGGLHRLAQVCPDGSQVTVFRDRMRQVIQGERPIRATREAMIEAFNIEYNDMAKRHLTCGVEAQIAFRREAGETLEVTDRLSRGMAERALPR